MKTTALNAKANRKLKELFLKENNLTCEVRLDSKCWVSAVTFAHRHKRNWYKGKPEELLWSRDQVILACPYCHDKMERDKELTEQLFNKLRP